MVSIESVGKVWSNSYLNLNCFWVQLLLLPSNKLEISLGILFLMGDNFFVFNSSLVCSSTVFYYSLSTIAAKYFPLLQVFFGWLTEKTCLLTSFLSHLGELLFYVGYNYSKSLVSLTSTFSLTQENMCKTLL